MSFQAIAFDSWKNPRGLPTLAISLITPRGQSFLAAFDEVHEPETTVFLMKELAKVEETCEALEVKVIARIADNASNVQGACGGGKVRKIIRKFENYFLIFNTGVFVELPRTFNKRAYARPCSTFRNAIQPSQRHRGLFPDEVSNEGCIRASYGSGGYPSRASMCGQDSIDKSNFFHSGII